ncbi:MAG: efflux RND transporter periplasmic adaptor subunit [Cryomorphaceae bacterium]|nr:efflux RND transporter periplasmic adaptor subunit [Cryomorphaceae bacterium]
MNKFIIISICSILLIGCESPNAVSESELEARQAELTLQIDSLSDLLKEVERELLSKNGSISKTPVTVYKTSTGLFEHYVEILGTLEADKNAEITAETQGTISAIHVREGEQVKKGQLLLELDGAIIQNNIREAETQLKFAKTVFDKQERLWKQNIGSELQYLESKNNVENLQSRLQTLKAQFNQTRVIAPFDGKVDEIFVKIGQLASPQAPLLRLVNLKEVYLNADVSERHITQIREGSKARLEFPSLDEIVYTTVNQTGSIINPSNRTFRVVFRLENSNEYFKPNLMANVYILDYAKDSTVSIPNRLIQQDPEGKDYIYVALPLEGDETSATAERRFVTVGKTYQGRTEVILGIEPEELLVDKGSRSIKTGQILRITELSDND